MTAVTAAAASITKKTTVNMAECFICINTVSLENIKKCPYCEFECCLNCIKHHVNTSQKTEKNCMNCKKKHTRSILVDFLGKTYVDKLYKTDIKELLFKEEMLLVPRSLPEIKKRRDIRLIENKIESDRNEFEKMGLDHESIEFHEQGGLMHGRSAFYRKQIAALKGMPIKTKTIKQYKFPCATRDCNGFVDANWLCTICDKETCKSCNITKEDNHVCKQEDIDTAELIKKDSKSCPKCNMSIMKTSGCDQMWCVSCHTTFDWKTLQIKTSGVLHNPEYFRYMRENGIAIPRNPNDNPCRNEYDEAYTALTAINAEIIKEEKELQIQQQIIGRKSILVKNYITHEIHTNNSKISDELQKKAEKFADKKIAKATEYIDKHTISQAVSKDYMKCLFTFYRDINHLESIEIREMQRKIDNTEQWKDDIRIQYLDKMIDEYKYKADLVKHHKQLEYLQETIGYHTTVVEICKAYFINKMNKFRDEIIKAIEVKGVISIIECSQLMRLREFVKDIYDNGERIKRVYGYSRLEYLPRLVNPLLLSQ